MNVKLLTAWQQVLASCQVKQGEVARALALPDVKERLAMQNVSDGGETPEEFAVSLRNLMATYAAIAKETNIKASAN